MSSSLRDISRGGEQLHRLATIRAIVRARVLPVHQAVRIFKSSHPQHKLRPPHKATGAIAFPMSALPLPTSLQTPVSTFIRHRSREIRIRYLLLAKRKRLTLPTTMIGLKPPSIIERACFPTRTVDYVRLGSI
jgi:hypothetical protein